MKSAQAQQLVSTMGKDEEYSHAGAQTMRDDCYNLPETPELQLTDQLSSITGAILPHNPHLTRPSLETTS